MLIKISIKFYKTNIYSLISIFVSNKNIKEINI
jgi:hypothetical protein